MASGNISSSEDEPIRPNLRSSTKKRGGWRAIKYILSNESFERLASMGLIANLTVYLRTKYNMSGILLVNVVTIWGGTANISTLAGAFVSDAYLGRFLTLLLGTFASFLRVPASYGASADSGSVPAPYGCFLVIFPEPTEEKIHVFEQGMGAMALTAGITKFRPPTCHEQHPDNCIEAQQWQLGILYAALGLLALGAGGVRPCGIAFGADQFDSTTEKGRKQLESFFNWWYFSFTISLLIALTAVVYIQTEVSWVIGYIIPTACLFCAIVIFLIGRHTYIYIKPQGSIFTDLAKVLVSAYHKRKITLRSSNRQYSFYDPPVAGNGESPELVMKLARTNRFKWLDKAAVIAEANELNDLGVPKNGWRLCSVQQVEQLKCLVGIMPVWVTGVGCMLVLDQQSTFGILQAMQINRSVGAHFDVPPGWLGTSAMIALSIWIFVYEQIYIPILRRFLKRDVRLTMGQRINIGIIMSILCMIVAGVVEWMRRDRAIKSGSFVSPISFAWLLPQFVLSGLTEAFENVAMMEFFTTQMPESMRSVAGSVFFLTLSISSYLSSVIVNVMHSVTKRNGHTPWLGGHDLNKNRLEYYYYIIAGLGGLNLIYFTFFASNYAHPGKIIPDTKELELESQGNQQAAAGN